MLVFTVIMIFEAHDYAMAGSSFAVSLVSMLLSLILDKIAEKRAFNIHQKCYAVVVISEKCVDDDDSIDPFEKEEGAFFDTGKVGFTYHYDFKQWNMRLKELPAKRKESLEHLQIVHDPTFMVITAYDSSKTEEAMMRPFLITSNPSEAVRFIKEYGK